MSVQSIMAEYLKEIGKMEFRYISTVEEAKQLQLPKVISLDTEYTELNIKKANLLSVSIGVSDNVAYLIAPDCIQSINFDDVAFIFVVNGPVDWYMLRKNNVFLQQSTFKDCMLMEHLINENITHNLGDMAIRYFQDNYKEEFWGKYNSFSEAPKEEADQYEMKDACYTYTLGVKFYEEINNTALIEHVHRLQWALFDTEIRGLTVDVPLMVQTKETMGAEIAKYLPLLRETFKAECSQWEVIQWVKDMEKLKTDAGKARVRKPIFSFASDKQVKWLVYNALQCPKTTKTKTGQPSTDYDTLKGLSGEFPQLEPLVKYKDTKAVYATFVESMLERVQDGRIYPRFNINGTKNCGRISHYDPNMGNMPKEGVIRNFFIPDADRSVIGADYAQLEVVVEANLTNDKQLIRIMNEGISKHDITAEGLGIDRTLAKTVNFALQYGAGVRKLAKVLSCSIQEATYQFNKYWEVYSGVKALKDQIAKQVIDTGVVTTLFGRSKHFPREFETEWELAKAQRQGYSALIQGTGADCTNRATYLWADHLSLTGNGCLWMSVHDELVGEVDQNLAEGEKAAIVEIMEGVTDYVQFKYPLRASSYGPFAHWRKA